MSKTEYTYRGYDGYYFTVYKKIGYWGLKVTAPDRIILLAYDYFPTKRAAYKAGMNVLWNYTIKKDGAIK